MSKDRAEGPKAAAGSGGKPCPICRKPSSDDARPFCSKRCADIDLHRWIGGVYAIPVTDPSMGIPDGSSDENES